MRYYVGGLSAIVLMSALVVAVQARTISPQQAESFARKIAQIREQAEAERPGPRRTPVTEDEVNSWFTYRAPELLPAGVSDPKITILGDGRVSGTAIVDLEQVAKRRPSASRLDPWNFLAGRVPLTVTGTLRTRNGVGRIELQSAQIYSVPVPVTLVQEMVTYYSRSERYPDGVRLDEAFRLPSAIREIQIGQGQAFIVQ